MLRAQVDMLDKAKQFLKHSRSIEYCNSVVKALWQERKAARDLGSYCRQAARRGLRPMEEHQLGQALAERLAGRGITPRPRSKGDLHIFFAYGLNNWERALAPALRAFGEVTEFEWTSLGYDQHEPAWLEVRQQMNRAMLEAFYEAQAQAEVDVVFGYASGYTMDPRLFAQMGQAGAVVFNLSLDDKLEFPGRVVGGRYCSPAALAGVVDLNLTNAPASIIKYMVHGGLAMFWPEAAWPAVHQPYELEFEYDVSFVGQRYGWRPRFIEKLAKLGVKIECFGKGWPNGPLSDEEMVKLYSRSRINLGFAGVGHSRRLMCLKGRDFEVPASGGLYLTQDNPELSLVYDVGREVVTYSEVEDCAETIHWLLANPERAAEIREAGYRRTAAEHNWEHRFEQVFQLAGLLIERSEEAEAERAG